MREISEQEHQDVLTGSIKKFMKAYKLLGGYVQSNLKVVDIIYRLLYEACGVASLRDKHKLTQLYYKLCREDRLICNPLSKGGLFKSNNFIQFHAGKEPIPPKPVDPIVGYLQADISDSVISIKGMIEHSTLPDRMIETVLSELNKGYYFQLDRAGRLTIVWDKEKPIYSIYDILGNDITSAFDLSVINNNFVIISKNFFSYGQIYLKLI